MKLVNVLTLYRLCMLQSNLGRPVGTTRKEDGKRGDNEVNNSESLKYTKQPQVLQLRTPRGIQHQPQEE
jgi:hypothetical protein